MRWSERQRAMLQEMGVRLWLPADAPDANVATLDDPVQEPADPAGAAASTRSARPPGPAEQAAPAGGADAEDAIALGEAGGYARATGGDRIAGAAPAAVAAGDAARRARTTAPRTGETDGTALAWEALAARAAAGAACPRCGRVHAAFGSGNRRATWMIVGDAAEPDGGHAGAPFDGKAGQLLDNMLAAVGLTRAEAPASRQVYVAPAVRCQPAERPQTGEPAAAAHAAAGCEPLLRRQIKLVQPRIVLVMGRTAAHNLLQSGEPIGKLRGRVHRHDGIPVIATHHPAYLLRQPQDKADAWDDLCLALQTLKESASA